MEEDKKGIKELVCRIKELLDFYSKGKYEFIYKNCPNFVRQILNASVSHLLNVEVDDTLVVIKKNHRALHYFELRILIYLRSKRFEIKDFVRLVDEIRRADNSSQYFHKVDLQLFEALPIFAQYIKDPLKIDELIKTHQYVSGLWKNGSKYLHFYTLHNEEHSIELIKQCVKITKTIDYLKLKTDDYYVLFMACYLHDISMALHPNLENFSIENPQTDFIYSKWKRDVYSLLGIDLNTTSQNHHVTELEQVDKVTVKQLLLSYFVEIDEYFESKIRDRHAVDSASFIKEHNDLRFIHKAFRQLIADVSESHYYEAKDVYKLKSQATCDLFAVKYMMIILRLADLFDMSRERISTNFLRQNLDYMSPISKFHWISHLAIDKCHLESEFEFKGNNQAKPDTIDEKIKIVIGLNTRQLTALTTANKCNNWCASVNSNNIIIEIKDDNKSECKGLCSFSCKWVMKKQEYLFKELYELQQYLNRLENNIFKTSFFVELRFDKSNGLPQEYLDVISEAIQS